MKIISHPDEAQLQIRVDTQNPVAPITYQYGNFSRWRITPHTSAEFLADEVATLSHVYDFFDRQWRGC